MKKKKKKEMKEKKDIKEFLYIDTELVDSLLSQIKDGLVKTITRTEQSVTSLNHQNSVENTTSGKVSIVGSGVSNSTKFNHTNNKNEQNLASLSLGTVYYDYAIEILESELNLSLSTSKGSALEERFILSRNEFSICNFSELNNLISLPAFKESILDDVNNSATSESFQILGDASQILGDVNYIKLGKNLIIPKNSNFRVSETQLELFKNSDRYLTVLGIVESNLSKKDFDLQLININNIKGIATLNILKELNVVEDNSKLILPIALYFK
nr:hypothetical protein [uncultured Ligilactobacillus sp.]